MDKHHKTLSLTKQEMKELGFKYDFSLQDYIYKFSVYKSKKKESLVFCKLGIDEETQQIFFNICNVDDTLYTPFYNREYGKSKVVEVIDRNIKKEFKKLGVVEK